MLKNKVKSTVNHIKSFFKAIKTMITAKIDEVFYGISGEAYVDTGVKILIAVVIGGLILTLLYALFSNVIAPNVDSAVEGMFAYTG